MYRTPQELGSFGAKQCPQPAKCLADADRLWLVSTMREGQPLSGMPKATATAVRRNFRVVKTRELEGLTLVLLERTAKAATGGTTDKKEDVAHRKIYS
jgi:mannosyltransferase